MTEESTKDQGKSAGAETIAFQADVTRVLRLVINSLYSNREIFLRELVSNASDALDKLKFKALTEPALLEPDATLEVRVRAEESSRTLVIEDTGVGMSREELVKFLGTVAHSGTQALLEQLQKAGAKGPQLIGQFGVGFYSAFLVADRVEVISRAAGSAEAWRWSSDGDSDFTVEPAERDARGTSVILHVKEEHKEFLGPYRLREVLTRYSDYVSFPIKLHVVGDEEEKGEEAINRAAALWQRPKSELTEEQYDEFYKHLTHDWEPPLAHTHFRVEGTQEFVGLLFIPERRPSDMELAPGTKRRGLRLFVKRVFIMDDAEELLPTWLRFVRGVVDSDDLPLNVSRELLQDGAVVRGIKKQVVKKTLELLENMAKEEPADYEEFWKNFGSVLKEGALDYEHKDKLAELFRFESTHDESEKTSLADYVGRMKEGQKAIYYLLGDSRRTLADSAYLEALRERGYEVLLMTDPVDQWVTDNLGEYQGKKLVSAMRAELGLERSAEEKKDSEKRAGDLQGLLGKVKSVLGDHVKDVRLSERLTDSPCVLVIPEGGAHAMVERLLKEHGRAVPGNKRIFELNAKHPLVEKLRGMHEKDADDAHVGEWIELLYDQALVAEGGTPSDPVRFVKRLTALMQQAGG